MSESDENGGLLAVKIVTDKGLALGFSMGSASNPAKAIAEVSKNYEGALKKLSAKVTRIEVAEIKNVKDLGDVLNSRGSSTSFPYAFDLFGIGMNIVSSFKIDSVLSITNEELKITLSIPLRTEESEVEKK
jgi:hypothetical protein